MFDLFIVACFIVTFLIGCNVGYVRAEEDQKQIELEMENLILKEVLEDELF